MPRASAGQRRQKRLLDTALAPGRYGIPLELFHVGSWRARASRWRLNIHTYDVRAS
ncbi:hypothetical protein QK290_03655 [Pseudarthrobacter sp. AL07]|uniref:hypothetical protein n=1 Tax=unclassified Pseudarthrobacter TaxID=2647000 RepID=UPI00249BF70D|nr:MULTISPECIES: hypothetical protein [unclassified Pseudarthrobacter]MDI3207633.1 hypothetical protein [Pseudarthrobacter sp. AL07]